MSLLSIEFFCFLIGLLFLYYMVPVRLRWIVLLAGSVAFYMFSGWKYLILVIFTTVTTFLAAGRLEGLNGRIKEDVKKLAEKVNLENAASITVAEILLEEDVLS